MDKNLAGSSIQTEFIFEVEIEKEINGIQKGVLRISDSERADNVIKGVIGKRLT